jgi:uroporphyrinogen III methyltransferase/synthase
VSRARALACSLGAALRALGAEVIELPAIRIEPRLDAAEVRDAVAGLHTYALVCLTSPNGVRLLFEAMADQGRDARALANATIAAIGPGTAAALAERGVIADIVPKRFVAEALVEALAPVEVAERPVLVARAAEARDVLPNALAERRSTSLLSMRRSARSPTPRRSRRRALPTTSPSPPPPRSATCSRSSATASRAARASSRSVR